MGAKGSKQGNKISLNGNTGENDNFDLETLSTFSYGMAATHHVQHFIPPNLPVLPKCNTTSLETCARTWKMLANGESSRIKQHGKPGLTLFYDEFFYRLFQRDTTFPDVFPTEEKRVEILLKAMGFVMSSQAGSEEAKKNNINRCRFLGHKHRTFILVRAHHFAAYVSTCIEVIMFWLAENGTPEVGEAWSNVFGFFLEHMLESFLFDRIDPYYCYQNTVIEAVREVEKASSKDGSEHLASARSAGTAEQESAR